MKIDERRDRGQAIGQRESVSRGPNSQPVAQLSGPPERPRRGGANHPLGRPPNAGTVASSPGPSTNPSHAAYRRTIFTRHRLNFLPEITTADGSPYLTVLDLAKWDAALYTERLPKRSTLEQRWTPVRLNSGATHPYGFGCALGTVNGHQIIEHGGSWQGCKAFIARYVGDSLAVIVLANLAQADPGRLAHGVAGLLEPALRAPERPTPPCIT